MTYYKVLENGKSCHGGAQQWSLPTANAGGTWRPGDWQRVDGPIVVCENGLHLTAEPYRWYTWDCTMYEAEGGGEHDAQDDKTAFAEARLLRPVPHPDWWLAAQDFVARIAAVPFFQPDGDPDPTWRLFTAPTWDAARGAARDAALGAALDAALGAAWGAARDAARGAARGAALDAARGAARGAAWDAALDAAWDAARGAALITGMLVVGDLPVAPEHRAHAEARWQVWQKGYALLGDVAGVLYVYAAEGAAEKRS